MSIERDEDALVRVMASLDVRTGRRNMRSVGMNSGNQPVDQQPKRQKLQNGRQPTLRELAAATKPIVKHVTESEIRVMRQRALLRSKHIITMVNDWNSRPQELPTTEVETQKRRICMKGAEKRFEKMQEFLQLEASYPERDDDFVALYNSVDKDWDGKWPRGARRGTRRRTSSGLKLSHRSCQQTGRHRWEGEKRRREVTPTSRSLISNYPSVLMTHYTGARGTGFSKART